MQGPTLRLPATMAAAFGAAGLYIAYTAMQAATDATLGLAIAAGSMLLLLVFVFVAGMRKAAPAQKPVAKRVPTPALMQAAPEPEPVAPKMSRQDKKRAKHAAKGGIDFEYPDDEVAPAAPTQFEPPQGFQDPPRGTVVTTDPTQAQMPRAYGQDIQERAPPAHAGLTQKYTESTPMVREILTQPTVADIPEFRAEIADPMQHPSMIPPNTVRGKCGQCDTLLLAPTQRPIRLRCPSCTRATLLEA